MSIWSGIEIHSRVQSDSKLIQLLKGLPSSVIGDVMGGRLKGTTRLLPVNRSVVNLCGNAVTVRVRAGDNLLIHKALGMLEHNDVLLVDGEGDTTRALVGEIMLTMAQKRGACGFVIDGAIRDVDAFEARGFPCWARGVSLRGPYKDGPGSINLPITVGGMLVNPGDIIVCDSDGVVAVPANLAVAVAQKANEKIQVEQETIKAIESGTYSSSWVDDAIQQKQN